MIYEAIILGEAVLLFLFFDLWSKLRENHKELSILFFGFGMMMVNVVAWTIYRLLVEETAVSYLSGFGAVFFQVVMWLTIVVAVYVIFGTIFGFIKTFINWVCVKFGWEPPFKEEEQGWI